MPEDYAKNIRSAVSQGLLDPENDVQDAQLLFACACGTMLGFRGNKVCGGLLFFCVRFFVFEMIQLSDFCFRILVFCVGTLRASIYRLLNGLLPEHASIYAWDGVSRAKRFFGQQDAQNQGFCAYTLANKKSTPSRP
jgi:hypothetical protein